MDVVWEVLLDEVATIGYLTHGTFTYTELTSMPWKRYDYLWKGVQPTIKKLAEKDGG